MKVFADLHVHYYENYSLENFFKNIFSRLASLIKDSQKEIGLIALTETDDCHFYQDLRESKLVLPSGYQMEVLEGAVMMVYQDLKVVIIPGRQVNTIERIELLSLGSDNLIKSGDSLQETLEQIESAFALAVLNWAPGKWWFKRGGLIKRWISRGKPYLICDTSLRPIGYLKPILTRLAERHGWVTIYGSDPLPDQLEEKNIFKYFAKYNYDFNFDHPLESFKSMLLTKAEIKGKRSSFLELFIRMKRYYA